MKIHDRRCWSRRSGWVLPEVAIAAALLSVILGTVAALILLWRIQLGEIETRVQADRELQRLHVALESDLVAPRVVNAEGTRLDIQQSDGREVRYKLDGATVHRTVWMEDRVAVRDAFELAVLQPLPWRIDTEGDGRALQLPWKADHSETNSVIRTLRISWRRTE